MYHKNIFVFRNYPMEEAGFLQLIRHRDSQRHRIDIEIEIDYTPNQSSNLGSFR